MAYQLRLDERFDDDSGRDDSPPTPVPNQRRLLNAEDIAEILAMRVDYVYALTRRDAIPHLRFGRTLRFRVEAIEAWLEELEAPSGKARPSRVHLRGNERPHRAK